MHLGGGARYYWQQPESADAFTAALDELRKAQFVQADGEACAATPFGRAVSAAGFSLQDGEEHLRELRRAAQTMVLRVCAM